MPSSATITSFYSFTQRTVIKSAEVNGNFDTFRGHIIPVDPNTATAAVSGTYDLGASDHQWNALHSREARVYAATSSGFYVGMKAPTLSASYDLVLPPTFGTSSQYLRGGTTTSFASFTPPTIQRLTSGSGTYTTPAGVLYIVVEMIGGGGGGQASANGAWGNTGATGGTTTFGSSLLTAFGGAGGNVNGGSGGAVTVNSPAVTIVGINGGGGGAGQNKNGAAPELASGIGGSGFFGGAGKGVIGPTTGDAAIANSGAGGSGGNVNSASGTGTTVGAGGGAGGYIKAMISSPAASYAYAVGAGGAGGTAGLFAGGAGGSGVIIVTEYYH